MSKFKITAVLIAAVAVVALVSDAYAQRPGPPGGDPDLRARVMALEARVRALTAQVAALRSGFVPRLGDFVEVVNVPTDLNGDGDTDDFGVDLDGDGIGDADERLVTVRIFGANLQVVNGHPSERTNSLNGLGNIIVGYNEPRASAFAFVCSNGEFSNEADCTNASFHWAQAHKSGSHNLVGGGGVIEAEGQGNSYSSFGGLVFGVDNVINGPWATISGGFGSIASGGASSVGGGFENRARGTGSSVGGGQLNTAVGEVSSVSGGLDNTASGDHSSVGGGEDNRAIGPFTSVSGGRLNQALSSADSVSGGTGNTASGGGASVSGGAGRSATGPSDWAAGSLLEDF